MSAKLTCCPFGATGFKQVESAYYITAKNRNKLLDRSQRWSGVLPAVQPRNTPEWLGDSSTNDSSSSPFEKRADLEPQRSPYWELSQVSTPRDVSWLDQRVQEGNDYKYWYHPSAGEGQYVYALESSVYLTHDASLAQFSFAARLLLGVTRPF